MTLALAVESEAAAGQAAKGQPTKGHLLLLLLLRESQPQQQTPLAKNVDLGSEHKASELTRNHKTSCKHSGR